MKNSDERKEDKRVKLTPEARDALVNAVLKTGSIHAAVKLLPGLISDDYIYKRRQHDEELDRRLTLAVKAHRAGNPDADIEKILALDAALIEYLQHGDTEIICQRDPQTKAILSITEKTKKRFDPRVWDILHPKKPWAESAVLLVTSNQMESIVNDEALTEEERRILLTWLPRWIQKAAEDLQKQGLPVKYLDTLS